MLAGEEMPEVGIEQLQFRRLAQMRRKFLAHRDQLIRSVNKKRNSGPVQFCIGLRSLRKLLATIQPNHAKVCAVLPARSRSRAVGTAVSLGRKLRGK